MSQTETAHHKFSMLFFLYETKIIIIMVLYFSIFTVFLSPKRDTSNLW